MVSVNWHKLSVPYYSQNDNEIEPHRTCNSSVHAMLVEYLRPGTFRSDDEYIGHLYRYYGDTTNHQAHTKMLRNKCGIDSTFEFNLGYDDLDSQISKGFPVPIGVFHRGALSDPFGGHIILIVGKKNDETYFCHDPLGNPFQYDGRKGYYAEMPKASLDKRWLIEGHNTGWGRVVNA